MTARDEILARVRRGVAKGDVAQRKAAALAVLAERQRGPQPVLAGRLVERFQSKAESLSSSVAVVGDRGGAPAAVAHYLDSQELSREIVVSPELAALDWAAQGLRSVARGAVDADRVGVTGWFCAVAETGTLMLLSGPESPATVSLLPETHIALVDTSRIV